MSSWFHVFFSTSFSKLWLDDNVQSGLSGPYMVTLERGKSTSCVGVRAGCLSCGLQTQFFRPRVQSAAGSAAASGHWVDSVHLSPYLFFRHVSRSKATGCECTTVL